MDFYQNQVNLAVWLATSGCGVSWRDHLDIDRPLARSVFRFHVYYQVRRILEELQAPLPQDASSKVDHAFGTGLYMAPSDMRLHIGTAIAGYNNGIIIAPAGQPLGVSPDTNSTPVPAPVETGETGLVVPQTHDKPDTSGVMTMTQAPSAVAPPMTHSVVPVVPPEQTQKAQDHEDEKTALVAAGVVLGLVSLWLMRR